MDMTTKNAGDGRPMELRPRTAYRRILLVNPPMAPMGAEFMMEDVPLRLEYLAAFIRRHVERVELVDLTRETKPLAYFLRKFRPDLVGISVNYISTHVNALGLAGVAKRLGADVVVGGYQATALAAEFAGHPDVDYVVRGEGEVTLLELVQNRPLDEILGLSYECGDEIVHNAARPLIEDLDSLPFPERSRRKRGYKLPFADLESDAATAYDMIITSRGCWGHCTFCTEPLMSHGQQRYRKPEKVIEELEEIVALHRGKRLRVHIADPNFGGDKQVLEKLCDRLIEFRARCKTELHFFISVRASTIADNDRLARKMVQAGMDYVFVGMESPKAEDLKAVAKGAESQAKQQRAADFLVDNGAAVMSCFLLGLPGQSEHDILGMVDYAKKLRLSDCYFSVMTPLPGSKLYDKAKREGQLLETDFTKYRLYDMVFKHDTLSRAKMRELCVRANAKWYDDLMLLQEHRRWENNGRKKRSLYDYAGKFKTLVGFFAFIGSNAGQEFADLDPELFVKDLPNPGLRRFTEQTPMHTYLEMGRFLRILGEQTIQVSLKRGQKTVANWVAATTSRDVKYLDATDRPVERPSIAINISMDDGALTPGRILGRIWRDNASLKSRLNLARLATAAGGEVLGGYARRARVSLRAKAVRLAVTGKTRLTHLLSSSAQ